MDVWGSQGSVKREAGADDALDEDYDLPDSGKDALVVLVDVRKAMFAPYKPADDDASDPAKRAPATWFHAVVELIVKLMKSKVVANDNSLLSVVFFGSHKRTEANTLESVYEFQALGFPSAQKIKDLQVLLEGGFDAQREFQSMDNSEKIAISNALWHCGIAFSNANLKKKDSQRVWLFTNDDSPPPPDAEEKGRVQKQVQNHVELKRTLNLFYITPSGKQKFDLSKFYSCVFKDYALVTEDDELIVGADGTVAQYQPAFPVDSLEDMMEGSLRKRFRKRRLATLALHVTKDVSVGVELYALVVVQKKTPAVKLSASTNTLLKSDTKWLCEDTGAYVTPDQIKTYIEYGGKRMYFSRDDVLQIKHYDAPGLQLICFKPITSLKWNDNTRAPYFIFPAEEYIEGSAKAFVALLNSMVKKQKYALARLIARKSSEPRLVALVPQEEVNDDLGQVQPSGFNVIFLPYLDDIRDIPVEAAERGTREQIDAAKALISKLKLTEVPSFENPGMRGLLIANVVLNLQKHYSSVQALALGEEELEFDETKDTTLPDEEGFGQADVKDAIETFKDVCGGDLIDKSNLKRKCHEQTSATAARKAPAKKGAKSEAGSDVPSAGDELSKEHWSQLVATNAIQKKTIPQIKDFLHAHGIAATGKKAELVEKVHEFVES
ncbi:Atp-dependent dna helicase 2 subunit, partial [Globisporangium splendens]